MTKDLENIKIAVFSLGCKTNYYEGVKIASCLSDMGFCAVEGLVPAHVYVINTCAVTAEAEGKSRQCVSRALKLNKDAKIFLVGCAVEHDKEQFSSKENIVYLAGNADKMKTAEEIASYLKNMTAGKDFSCDDHAQPKQSNFSVLKENAKDDSSLPPLNRARRYIKIQDGCDNFCSYCIVPYLRGASVSRSIEEIVREVKEVREKEIVLIGIDISQYGIDRGRGETLADLFDALSFYEGRIRLGSLYQNAITAQLLSAMKDKGCRHFHLSLQSGCDATLKRMNRRYASQDYFEAVKLIRSFYHNAALCADVIVGFCGESEEEFSQTYTFIEKVGFADIHIFPYSPRRGTAAYGWEVPDGKIVKERVERLTLLKKKLIYDFLQKALAQKKAAVLIEEEKGGFSVGYTDNYIRVYIKGKLPVGGLVEVKLLILYKDGLLASTDI